MRIKKYAAAVLAVALAGCGCGRQPAAPGEAMYFQATVETADVNGTECQRFAAEVARRNYGPMQLIEKELGYGRGCWKDYGCEVPLVVAEKWTTMCLDRSDLEHPEDECFDHFLTEYCDNGAP